MAPAQNGLPVRRGGLFRNRHRRVFVAHNMDRGAVIMRDLQQTWQFWAVLSAVFAALTAIFAKVRRRRRQLRSGNLHSHHGHPGRSGGDGQRARGMAAARGNLPADLPVPAALRTGHGGLVALLLPCAEDRRRRRVAPIDKLSVVMVAVFSVIFLGERANPAELGRRHPDRSRGHPRRLQGLRAVAPSRRSGLVDFIRTAQISRAHR